jgi:hypothetical protein
MTIKDFKNNKALMFESLNEDLDPELRFASFGFYPSLTYPFVVNFAGMSYGFKTFFAAKRKVNTLSKQYKLNQIK